MLTYEVAREMATGQNLRYAELTCTPYTSVRPDRDDIGMPIEAYTEAIEDARVAAERDFGLVLRWIYDIPGESGLPAAEATLGYALDHGPSALVGFGLGGPEIGVPRAQFQPHFDAARAAGLHSVPHAGETTGPETVWDSIRLLGAERIGHGTSSASDPALLAHLAAEGITLEVCPSSNIATRAVASLADHPLRAFVEAGVPVTINSDDPPMFGTTLNEEYAIAADLLSLSTDGVADLSRAAVRASFAPDDVKTRILGEIDDYVSARLILIRRIVPLVEQARQRRVETEAAQPAVVSRLIVAASRSRAPAVSAESSCSTELTPTIGRMPCAISHASTTWLGATLRSSATLRSASRRAVVPGWS